MNRILDLFSSHVCRARSHAAIQITTAPLYEEKEKLEVVQRTALHLSTQINPHGASRGELQQHHAVTNEESSLGNLRRCLANP